MGLFSWLFGSTKKYKELPSKVTKGRQRKFELLVAECQEFLATADRVFVVCHFDESLERLEKLLEDAGVPFESIQSSFSNSDLQRLLSEPARGRVVVLPSRYLNISPSSVSAEMISSEQFAAILIAEMFPFRERDQAVYDLAENLPIQSRLRVFVSLDDFTTTIFVGPSVRAMLEQMGFGDNDCMESGMVGRRLKAAQKKIQLTAPRDNPHSEQSWFAAHPVDQQA